MDALDRAFNDTERGYHAAKASVSQLTDELLASGASGGPLVHRADLSKASEQLKHFRSWTFTAIRPIAQKIAGQPIRVGRHKTPRRTAKESPALVALDDHDVLRTLADPNDLMTSWSVVFTTVASLELTGRSLWWCPVEKGVRRIYPLPTSWLRGFEGSNAFTKFLISPPGHAGEPLALDSEECVYFHYPSPSDPHGATSPLMAAAGAVDSDEAIEHSQAAMFRQGIHPVHVLTVGPVMGPDGKPGRRPTLTGSQQDQLIDAVKQRYSSVAKHGIPLILDSLISDIKRLSNTVEEMDYLNSGKMTKEKILLTFGVNAIIAGQVEGANRASSLAAEEHFAEFTVNPKIELLSQALTGQLPRMFGDESLIVWLEPTKPNDVENTYRWAELLVRSSSVTHDELRALSPFALPEFGYGGNTPVGTVDAFGTLVSNQVNAALGQYGVNQLGQDLLSRRALSHAHSGDNGDE